MAPPISLAPAMLRRINVAPMMGRTDRHCRFLFRLLSPNAMLYSEMLTANALVHGDSERLLQHHGDAPAGVQLGGSDPKMLAAAARLVEQAGYQEVNLNCGCPSDRVRQGGIGACLMAEPRLVADCYDAMTRAVSVPVTVKSRIGVDDRDDYGFLHTFIGHLHDAGCRVFHVHARKAVLGRLSPKENREIPPLRYDRVRRIQAEFGDAEFILNGGIRSVREALTLLGEFPGIMWGRAPYANPCLLAQLDAALWGTTPPDRSRIVSQYFDYMAREAETGARVKPMARHLSGLFTGLPGARRLRRCLGSPMGADLAMLEAAMQTGAATGA